ncbi:O-antigen ligase family protein [Candidatus Uhrbacteria bacterium]|nr:O-antigen ligase family protein [Candidatus Uhrbacteria bacterium]
MSTVHKFGAFDALFIFAFIRVLSFLTWDFSLANQLITAVLVVIFFCISVKNIALAWVILVADFLLNGAGHFFELFGLLSRTWFLGIFGVIWFVKKIKQKDFYPQLPRSLSVSMIVAGMFILLAIANGYVHAHPQILILQDAVLYLFFLLAFPTVDLLRYPDARLLKIAKGYILGSTLFSLVTFFIYSSGLGVLRDPYYDWFRHIAAGKITDLGNHFFRIVLPEHLLMVPAILIIASSLMKNPKNRQFWLYALCASFVLMLNFSRMYFIGLVVGLLVLKLREDFKKWFLVSSLTAMSIVVLFVSVHFLASRGQSTSLGLLEDRISGVVEPTDEISGSIRMALLPDIFRTIQLHPWLGSGLGTTVSYRDPTTKIVETRTQFDWGYLEMFAELGIVGAFAYIVFLILLLYALFRAFSACNTTSPTLQCLFRGLLAGAIAFFVINGSTPALFQGFGVLYFVFIFSMVVFSERNSGVPIRA